MKILSNEWFFIEILKSLQECEQYKLNITNDKVNHGLVKHYNLKSVKSLRRNKNTDQNVGKTSLTGIENEVDNSVESIDKNVTSDNDEEDD